MHLDDFSNGSTGEHSVFGRRSLARRNRDKPEFYGKPLEHAEAHDIYRLEVVPIPDTLGETHTFTAAAGSGFHGTLRFVNSDHAAVFIGVTEVSLTLPHVPLHDIGDGYRITGMRQAGELRAVVVLGGCATELLQEPDRDKRHTLELCLDRRGTYQIENAILSAYEWEYRSDRNTSVVRLTFMFRDIKHTGY